MGLGWGPTQEAVQGPCLSNPPCAGKGGSRMGEGRAADLVWSR